MDLQLLDYFIYIGASVLLTIWVGRTLYRNGRPFLVSVFKEDGLADSVNRLLVIGFYLVNFGAAAILINTGGPPPTVADMLKQTVTRVGVVLLVLGFMHFNNLLVLHVIRRPLRQKPLPPINYNPYQPARSPRSAAPPGRCATRWSSSTPRWSAVRTRGFQPTSPRCCRSRCGSTRWASFTSGSSINRRDGSARSR